jgi:hypothetical protein
MDFRAARFWIALIVGLAIIVGAGLGALLYDLLAQQRQGICQLNQAECR